MIKKEEMEIVSVTEIAKDTVEMVLYNPYICHEARPGQFLHILINGYTLRRPISIAYVNKETNTVVILFKKIGEGTVELSKLSEGMVLDVLGPCGNGFQTGIIDKTVLLIGGGIGVPPLYFLGTVLAKQGIHVISIIGFQTKSNVFYEKRFRELGNTYVVTDDGSYGHKGLVTDVIDQVNSFDQYYTCGPLPMLKAVKDRLKDYNGYLSFEERMGCGVGACYACVIRTNDSSGYKKICQDGPVFSSSEVLI